MPTNVLIVLDGFYRFVEESVADFTFINLVDTLQDAGMQVTRAHHDNVTDALGVITNFNFSTSVDLLDFDVIWLFGADGRNSGMSSGTSAASSLSAAEMTALTNFMNVGGGIFATGDHDSIGSVLCGHIPRVRTMRAWFGINDSASPMPESFPRNFAQVGSNRADTVQKNPQGDYDLDDDGMDDGHVYFENQSDSIPQPISPTSSPAHPILRRNGNDITVYPDHMHEGQTLGYIEGVDQGDYTIDDAHYDDIALPSGTVPGFVEFPLLDGERELPQILAQGQVVEQTQHYGSGGSLDPVPAAPKPTNSLCAYDGRKVGVGRIVTGGTFHHYIDINLSGASNIDTPAEFDAVGPDAEKGQGFNYPGAEATFADIKAVFVNITNWLARPRPNIQLILERSTFSQDEVSSESLYNGALLVVVDGLKPDQFDSGPITTLVPNQTQLDTWAPTVNLVGANGIDIRPVDIDSTDPTLGDRLQRFTFTYAVEFVDIEDAFDFVGDFSNYAVDASLNSSAASNTLTDNAILQLVKSANPFMLDLANGNSTHWLSSDVRVFPVVAGSRLFGQTLPNNSSKAQALTFINNLMDNISVAQFESLSLDQQDSALSPFPETDDGDDKVYNFAIARVRLNGNSATADDVRVFFRIFTTQTTAALTYQTEGDVPQQGYKKTPDVNPIALPGTTGAGNEWLSFPFFAATRNATPENQTDPDNVQTIAPNPGNEVSRFYGALIDNNLDENYLPPSPNSAQTDVSVSELLMGEHQCLVAQIEYAGTPIPSGSLPSNSDKLSQRNIALSAVANPGLDASRMAFHTFQLESTPGVITQELLPDELMLEWLSSVPEGTCCRIHVPTWDTAAILELADSLYANHKITADDEHTLIIPGGGTRYIPLPRSLQRQTGVMVLEFPLGIVNGQRFDLAVRQITNRQRRVDVKPQRVREISREEAAKLLAENKISMKAASTRGKTAAKKNSVPKGVFDLGNGQMLITDLAIIDGAGDGAVIIQQPSEKELDAARSESRQWRETLGSFQIGVPVSVKEDMQVYHARLLSVFRWRQEYLSRDSRWFKTLLYYVQLLERKVQTLGIDPFAIPPTKTGNVGKIFPEGLPGGGDGGGAPGGGKPGDKFPDTDIPGLVIPAIHLRAR